jgi:carboxyl-terminal processing protease
MVDSLDDPYTTFFTPEEKESFDESIFGNFGGVGMEVGIVDDLVTVVSPLKNTPAEKAGMRSGDIIVAIDDESAVGFSIDEAVSRIRGEKGTTVKITIRREGVDNLMDIEIVRDRIKIPILETRIEGDIYVIELYNFTGAVKKDFRDAIAKFKVSPLDKLILDLRGNPGGYLDAAVEVSSYFLPEGAVVVQEDFSDHKKVLRSSGELFEKGEIEMVILINSGSASASEIVAGALSEHGVATTIGRKTFGKGSVQELVDISKNTSLKITIAKWLTPDGNTISGAGLEPDINVEILQEDIDAGVDPQLQAAIEFLSK